MICHCRTCRRVSGAPVVAWITVKPEAFKFTHGRPKRYKSSQEVERRFCGQCGAQLAYTCAGDEGFIDVATATLDKPDAYPPAHHSWLSHDIKWIRFGDGLPAFPKSRTD